jgi:transcriptional regulator with XRE-family HTH domain
MSTAEAIWREHLRQFGEFIKAQRNLNRLSQRELARLADLSDTYMSQLERGRHEPSLSVLRAIADGLGIRRDQLILHAAGLSIPDDRISTEEAIRGDQRLTAAQRTALLAVLRSYVEANAGGDADDGAGEPSEPAPRPAAKRRQRAK